MIARDSMQRIHRSLRAVMLLALIGLSACVTSGSKHAASSADVLSKRSNFVEPPALTYRPVALGETVEFEINDLDPVILLDKHETVYAKAFALPKWTAPYMLKVSSYIIGPADDPAVYYPTAIFLDANYQEVRRSHLSAFTFRRGGFNENSNLNGTLFINQANSQEAYVMIVSQRQAAHGSLVVNNVAVQQTAIMMPGSYGAAMWVIPMGAKESAAATAASATGRLKLVVENYQPVEMGEKKPAKP
jgi:hypothetical protein